MDENDIIKLLEDVRHELCFLTGLYAYDGACPKETFRLDYSALIGNIDKLIKKPF